MVVRRIPDCPTGDVLDLPNKSRIFQFRKFVLPHGEDFDVTVVMDQNESANLVVRFLAFVQAEQLAETLFAAREICWIAVNREDFCRPGSMSVEDKHGDTVQCWQ